MKKRVSFFCILICILSASLSACGGSNVEWTESKVVDASCLSRGYTEYKLSGTDITKRGNFQEALGHDFVLEQTVQPTCEANGFSIYKCSRCGLEKIENVINCLGHNYLETGSEEADCDHKGFVEYTCSKCSSIKIVEGDKEKGHSYELLGVEQVENNYAHDIFRCKNCGHIKYGESFECRKVEFKYSDTVVKSEIVKVGDSAHAPDFPQFYGKKIKWDSDFSIVSQDMIVNGEYDYYIEEDGVFFNSEFDYTTIKEVNNGSFSATDWSTYYYNGSNEGAQPWAVQVLSPRGDKNGTINDGNCLNIYYGNTGNGVVVSSPVIKFNENITSKIKFKAKSKDNTSSFILRVRFFDDKGIQLLEKNISFLNVENIWTDYESELLTSPNSTSSIQIGFIVNGIRNTTCCFDSIKINTVG